MNCQVCSSQNIYEVLDLGHHPPSDAFLTEEHVNQPETMYPVKMVFCDDCKLAQLSYTVDPSLLFTDKYVYTSSSNTSFRIHLQNFAKILIKKFNLTSEDFVVDIGSNDGTFIEPFVSNNIKALGVDPSSIGKVAIERGMPTINEFFDEHVAKSILEKYGAAKIVTALNVFQHVKELESLIKGVKLLIRDKGIFIVQSHYLLDLVQKLQHDCIYLEHLRYYSLTCLINVLKRFDLEVFDAEHIDAHGGSIRVFVCKKGDYHISDSVETFLQKENDYKLNSKETFDDFRKRVNENRRQLKKLLFDLKDKNYRIVGIGAPAKGNTLLNFCKIGPDVLDYMVETNTFKFGKYTPGTHIKIVDEDIMLKDQPEYALLLPWNIKDDIIQKLRAKGYRGKIILPTPTVAIV